MFTALAAAVAWTSLCRSGLASGVNAVTTVAIIFLSRDVWRAATTQEPFGLGLLTLVGAMFLPWQARLEPRTKNISEHDHNQTDKVSINRIFLWCGAGFCLGLGFANHHTTAFALVSAVIALVMTTIEDQRGSVARRTRYAGFFVVGFLVGALPVALVIQRILSPVELTTTRPGAPVPAFEWVTSSSDVIRYLLRADYGTFSLANNNPSDSGAFPSALQLFWSDFYNGNFGSFGWLWVILTIMGALLLIRRRREMWPLMTCSIFGMVFLLLNHLPANPDFIDINRRFHPAILITLIPMLATAIETLTVGIPSTRWILLTCAVVGGIQVMPDGRRDLRNFPEQHFTRALNIPPSGSIIVAASNEEIFGLSYAQVSLGIRPDIRILNLLDWTNPEKKHGVLTRIGIDPEPFSDMNRGQLIEALAKKQSLWIIDSPVPPKPAYMENLPCHGPFEILDLTKSSGSEQAQLRPGIPNSPEQADDSPNIRLNSSPWYASDQGLLDREENCRSRMEKQTQIPLQRIKAIDPSILQDLRYATTNNFTGINLYQSGTEKLSECWLLPEAAKMLTAAQKKLKSERPDLSLVVFDCARPENVQKIMWDIVKDTPQRDYVADPAKGSVHNYGCAVDLGIAKISLEDVWTEMDMGTPFDHFGSEAHTTNEPELVKLGKISRKAGENRLLLRRVMTESGFAQLPHEWWHYDCMGLEELKAKHKPIKKIQSIR